MGASRAGAVHSFVFSLPSEDAATGSSVTLRGRAETPSGQAVAHASFTDAGPGPEICGRLRKHARVAGGAIVGMMVLALPSGEKTLFSKWGVMAITCIAPQLI